MDNSKIINHLGENREHYFNAVSPPIIQTSNFVFETVDDYRKAMSDEFNNHLYTRGNNPTVAILREKLAKLQGTENSLVFSSGMAAISSTLYTILSKDDHVICIDNVYGWTREFLEQAKTKMNITTTYLSSTDFDHLEKYIKKNTSMIVLESPSSLLFEMQDLESISKIAKANNIVTMIDNSYAGLINPSPKTFGIDIIIHSASKYIGGHSDVVAGVICASNEIIEKIYHFGVMILGGMIAPFDAWLLIRSLRTLDIRIKAAAETAMSVVNYLKSKHQIKEIYFPFLYDGEKKKRVEKYLKNIMPMFTVQLTTNDQDSIEAFCNSFKTILMGPSWGGHESLMFPTCVFNKDDERAKLPNNLIRFYIGLDSYEQIIDDFEIAFKKLD